jgi:hypothetical protein
MLHTARVWQSGGQPGVQPGQYVPVKWTSVEDDHARFLTLAPGDTSRLVCPAGGAGTYIVGCQVAGVFLEGLFGYEFGLAKNGGYFAFDDVSPGKPRTCSGRVVLQPGDLVQLLVRHAVPAPLTLLAAGSLYPTLWLARVGSVPSPDAVMSV